MEKNLSPETVKLSKLFLKTLNGSASAKKAKRKRKKLKICVDGDPFEAAKNAGLRYVNDNAPGIRRIRHGKGFIYKDSSGKTIKDARTLNRIRSLAVPPAWTDVWICSDSNGHIQATGRDARRRKQYRYHPRWKEVRDCNKFDRMLAFAHAIPTIRERVEQDLKLPGMQKNKILATIVRLLEGTLIRVGNEEYAKSNNSYGLTTLRNKHVDVYGSEVKFCFRGKGGKQHNVGIKDRRIARIIKKCQELPGQDLFQYVNDEGELLDVTSTDVNEYLKEITQQEFTAKDFRTWAATVLASMAFQTFENCDASKPTKKQLGQAVEMVAKLLGNTPAICRKSYIHPAIVDGYMDGTLLKAIDRKIRDQLENTPGLAPEESVLIAYLKKIAEKAA